MSLDIATINVMSYIAFFCSSATSSPTCSSMCCCDPVSSKLRVLWVLLVLTLLKNEGIVQGWCMGLHDLTLPLSELHHRMVCLPRR